MTNFINSFIKKNKKKNLKVVVESFKETTLKWLKSSSRQYYNIPQSQLFYVFAITVNYFVHKVA